MKSWPLRVKLVVLMLVLLAAALVTTGTAGVYSTRDYLLTRVDAQLLGSVHQVAVACDNPRTQFGGPGIAPMQRNGYYVACIDRDGSIDERFFNPIGTSQSRPALPATAEGIGPITRLDTDTIGAYTTVSPVGGDGHQWRVLFARQTNMGRQPGGPGFARAPVVIAISLDDVDATVTRQLWTSVTIGAFVLVVLAVVAYLLVRSSLRPLVEVEQTAEAIAAGDLSRRVPEADPRTEIGGLSQALNTMLGQIETAFDERRASEEQARASEERMRRFIADASHELRTPLTSIRGFAELHRQSGKGDETIARIEHHATRMGLLVDDLLLLARMDQQRALEKKPVDLLSLATDALIDARVTATGHRLRLRTASSDDEADVEPPIVLGDGARLRQVVQNLLSNALTHTPAGTEVTVFVGTDAEHAILEVSDNGPGMSAEDASRVFERFYRTDPSRTRALGGSGLGLSIVAALVAAHGGVVTLRTAPGQGAAFRVSIQLLKATPQ
ncbi:HAMP domain-containing sensor histidine kinase [Dactylosporangium sp. NPDC051484]|uniref:sensor histidine kinase n=1 Tax=Dactylosporangium sp. NPDC051484 TaxID=3154942 RepID=UPI00344F5F59